MSDENFVRVIRIAGQDLIVGQIPPDVADGTYKLVVRIEQVRSAGASGTNLEGFICGCDNKSCACDAKEICGCNERCGSDCGVDNPCPTLA